MGAEVPRGGAPVVGAELVLGLIVLVSVGLGVLAGFRARRWARKRAAAPRWRIVPRLVPALLPVAVFAAGLVTVTLRLWALVRFVRSNG